MKRRVTINVILFIVLTIFLVSSYSYAIYTGNGEISGNIISADWNVTLNQTGIDNHLSVLANEGTTTYDLRIVSNSSVDVVYSIVISNLPTGVSVKLDNNANYIEQSASHEIIIPNAGTINYTGSRVTKTHTLTFKAATGATIVEDQQINIDVIARQNI